MTTRPKPTALIILDGWGYREETANNAIANANTPTWDRLLNEYPNALIQTSGEAVGLPDGQMGNSEVGHMNLGAGRIVYQNYTRINKTIRDGELTNNAALAAALNKKQTFSTTEWAEFGVENLRPDHYIKVGVEFFQPGALNQVGSGGKVHPVA